MKYKIWKMVVSTPFDYFIMLLIVLNTLLLMMKVFIYPSEHININIPIEFHIVFHSISISIMDKSRAMKKLCDILIWFLLDYSL